MNVFDLIQRHEACRLTPYRDSLGFWSVGWGHNCETTPISQAAADLIFKDDAVATIKLIGGILPFWSRLSDVRQAVLTDVAFNCGVHGLVGFRMMLTAIADGDFDRAATELLNSQAAALNSARYQELAEMLRRDTWPPT